jgi:plastocyanin
MESLSTQTNTVHKKRRFKKISILFLLIIVLALITFGLSYYQSKKTPQPKPTASQGNPNIRPEKPVPLRNIQKQQVDAGASKDSKKKLFEVTGGNFYFTPNKITVNSGDKVTIIFVSISGTHTLAIDKLHVKTPLLQSNQPSVVTFTADKKGTYEFYSSVANDHQMGMKGLLVVQ